MMALVLFLAACVGLVLIAIVAWREHRHFVEAENNRRRNDEQHRLHEDEVMEADTRLQLALDVIPHGIVVADSTGTVQFHNPYAQPFIDARHGEALVEATVAELLAEAVKGQTLEQEVELFGPPRRSFFVRAAPLHLQGQDYGAVVLIDDITEHQRLDAVRRDFVSNISHELKTPLGALSLLAETMVGEDDRPTISRLADRIQAEAIRMSTIVDDLLELSLIENDESSEFDRVVIQDVVHGALSRVQATADHKEIPLLTTLPALELVAWADRRQLMSAMFNLLDNAVKYSDKGQEITVTARQAGDSVELEVCDRGFGIPLRHQERIFERFYRVDQSRDRASGGVGLGLAIVRHVANNHGGEVLMESVEGEGSTFILRIPTGSDELAQPTGEPESASTEPSPQVIEVEVIEVEA